MKYSNPNLLLFAFLISIIWFLIGWVGRGLWVEPDIKLMNDAYYALRDSGLYADGDRLAKAAVQGMMTSTQDQHAAIMEGVVSDRYRANFAGETGITGLFPEKTGDQFVIDAIFPDGAAEEAGLLEGDIILSIGGHAITSETTDTDIGLLLRGPVGEPTEIVVERDGRILTFDVTRRERKVILAAEILPGDVAYLSSHHFDLNATEQVEATLRGLLAQKPKALIWDLRSNGGGSMDVTQAILSLFVEEGNLFSARLKDGTLESFPAQGDAIVPDIPIIVLIGERTYSSAETAAISLKELRNATLIGTTSDGKGTIQATLPLQPDYLLKYTIAEWLSPSGISVEGIGVAPDIVVEDDPNTPQDEPLEYALSMINQ